MPWRKTTVENERSIFIEEYFKGTSTMVDLCKKYNISTKTGYKWRNRFWKKGKAGLKDASRARKTQAKKISQELESEIVKIRLERPLGPKKIKIILNERCPPYIKTPSTGSIGNILKEAGLSNSRRKRKHVAETDPLGDCSNANDVWTYDFKGWFQTGDGAKCEPLTIMDAYSRYLLEVKHMTHKRTEDVWAVLERLFLEYGLPKRIRSDNGPPFATIGLGRLSPLAIKLIKVGVIPEWIEPGCPEQNGRLERFHLTLKNETAKPPAATLSLQIEKMNQFKKYYNHQRPHEALGQIPPSKVYMASTRKWDGRIHRIEYSTEYDVRKVCKGGLISWKGKDIFLTETLYQENIGIKEIDIGKMGIYYGPILLGVFDLTKGFTKR